MSDLILDIKSGVRQFGRAPGVTLAAVFTLAVGIGATTTVFSFVAAVMSLASPAADMDRLVGVWTHNRGEAETKNLVPPADVLDWRARATAFEAVAAWRRSGFSLSSAGTSTVRVNAMEVLPEYFDVFRWRPALGRRFTAEDARPGAPRVLVLSHTFWRDQFAEDPGVVGRTVRLDGEPATIVGVLPPTVNASSVLVPLAIDDRADDRASRTLFVFARLRPGVSIEHARDQMSAIGAALEAEHPATHRGWTVNVRPLQEEFVGPQARVIFALLLAAVVTVLLIGCANVANLLLARGAARRGEMAVRLALGANAWRLARQLIVESALLTLLGAAASLVVARWGLSILLAQAPLESAWVSGTTVNVRMLLVTLAGSALAVLVAGLAPALVARRTSLMAGLYASSRGGAADSARRLTRTLVGAEVALAVLLLVLAGLSTRSLIAIEQLDPGFDARQLMTARVSLPERMPSATAAQWVAGALAEMRRLPGVEHVGATSRLPFAGSRFNPNLGLEIEGHAATDERGVFAVDYAVTPGYFEAIRVPLLEGRRFTAADGPNAPGVVIVNRAMARRYWGDRPALGGRLRFGGGASPGPWHTIVGVVADMRNDDADQPPLPYVYVPMSQRPVHSLSFAMRTAGDPAGLAGPLRQALQTFDPDQALFEMKTMEAVVEEDLGQTRLLIRMMEVFAVIALGLAGVGIWGVLAQAVGQRTREIGLRMALGATARDVVGMIGAQGLVPVGVGLTIGLALGLAAAQLLRSVLFQVSPADPVTIVGTLASLSAVAVLAALGPAVRAARLDPLEALREE